MQDMICICFFFFNDTATTEIYTLSLHDALPISANCPPKRKPTGKSRRKARLPRRKRHDAPIPLLSKDGYGRLFFYSWVVFIPFISLQIPFVCHPPPFVRT